MVWLFAVLSAVSCVAGTPWASSVIEEHVGLVELNHMYSEKHGNYIYSQVIFWDFDPATGLRHVRAWRILDERSEQSKWPLKSVVTGLTESIWNDEGVRRRVYSHCYRESWTQVDPERWDSQRWPSARRQGLIMVTAPSLDRGPVLETEPPREVR